MREDVRAILELMTFLFEITSDDLKEKIQ